MKKWIVFCVCMYMFFAISCQNRNQAKVEYKVPSNEDSLRRADSLKNGLANRAMYHETLKSKIDSLQAKLDGFDKFYLKRNKRERAKWLIKRDRFKAAIEKLRAREKETDAISENRLRALKTEMDSTVVSIEYGKISGE